MISQFNTAFSKVNINLGNINTNGATQSAQKTGQQIGNQLGNSINQSLQANLNHVKQDIQNIFSSFSVQKLNNADIFKNFNLNRAKRNVEQMRMVFMMPNMRRSSMKYQ